MTWDATDFNVRMIQEMPAGMIRNDADGAHYGAGAVLAVPALRKLPVREDEINCGRSCVGNNFARMTTTGAPMSAAHAVYHL